MGARDRERAEDAQRAADVREREAQSEELQVSGPSTPPERMRITLKVWRQDGADQPGRMETHTLSDVSPHMSFLEMLDVLNEQLISQGRVPVAFDHDCREGICGACSLVIDGQAHGPEALTTACRLHTRPYSDGTT